MLRDPALIPLSRQHQHALALCVLIERGQGSRPELSCKATNLFELEIRNHFDIEERILFPAIQQHLGPMPLIEQLLAEHRQLEALAGGFPGALRQFGATLNAHIRREERELFEDVQKRLPRDVLEQLGAAMKAEAIRVCPNLPGSVKS